MILRAFIALFLAFQLSLAQAADSAWSRMVVFGDSLSDAGNAYALTGVLASPPYALVPEAPYPQGQGRFSNGPTWVEQLAAALDLPGAEAVLSASGGENYAVGGARARDGAGMDLAEQLAAHLQRHGGLADAEALYVLAVGGNDVRDALAAALQDPAAATAIVLEAAQRTILALQILYQAGARHVLVVNAPDIGLLPSVAVAGPLAQWTASLAAIAYNQVLEARLATLQALTPELHLYRFDLFSALRAVVESPADFGLHEVRAPCLTPGVTEGAQCPDPEVYLFWDGIHPTRTGHALLARAALALLAAP